MALKNSEHLKHINNYFNTEANTSDKSLSIHISPLLRATLQKLKSDNRYVQRLLSTNKIKRSYFVENNANFIDINFDGEEPILLYSTPELAIKTSSKVGYNSSRPIPLNVMQDYSNENIQRETTKPGRLLLKLFNKVENKDVEEFATIMKAANAQDSIKSMFKEVSGDLITYYYNSKSYTDRGYIDSGSSTLHNSCMQHSNINTYMDFYAKNEGVISLLILPDAKGKIRGRAIIWTKDGNKYIDRIYYDCFSTYTMFIKYCRLMNIPNISGRNPNFTNTVKGELTVQLKQWLFQYYPYVDTLIYLDLKTGKLSNKFNESLSGEDISFRKYIKTLMPTIDETHVANTETLLTEGIERDYINRRHLTLTEDRVLSIQHTGGRGSVINEPAVEYKEFVYLGDTYKAYLPKPVCIPTINNNTGFSPKWNTMDCSILGKSDIIKNSRYDFTLANNTDLVFVDRCIKRSNGFYFDNTLFTNKDKNQHTINRFCLTDKDNFVYNKYFDVNFLKQDSAKVDPNDEESYVPSIFCSVLAYKELLLYYMDNADKNAIRDSLPTANMLYKLYTLFNSDTSVTEATIALAIKDKRFSITEFSKDRYLVDNLYRRTTNDMNRYGTESLTPFSLFNLLATKDKQFKLISLRLGGGSIHIPFLHNLCDYALITEKTTE